LKQTKRKKRASVFRNGQVQEVGAMHLGKTVKVEQSLKAGGGIKAILGEGRVCRN